MNEKLSWRLGNSVEHNLTEKELAKFIKLHKELGCERETFIRRPLRLEDVTQIYLNGRLNVFEIRYQNGEWAFLRLDGGWL